MPRGIKRRFHPIDPDALGPGELALRHSYVAFLWARSGIKWLGLLVLVLQIFAFTSFIYEESLQASGFAVRSSMVARDPDMAKFALISHNALRNQALRWQKRYGWVAFWCHGAYMSYFERAAGTQIAGYYAEGVKLELWPESVSRYVVAVDAKNGRVLVDKWLDTNPLDCAIARVNEGIPGFIFSPLGRHPGSGGRSRIAKRERAK